MKKTILILSLIIILLAQTVMAAEYYVAPWGDDSNPGTFELPWASLQKAAPYGGGPMLLSPGDVLYVRGGTYSDQQYMYMGNSGTAANPITVKAYPGERPIFNGVGQENRAWLNIQGDYWIIDGLEIHNDNAYIYSIVGLDGDHNIIQNCHLSGRAADDTLVTISAIRGMYSEYNTIRNCTIEYVGDRSDNTEGDIIGLLSCDHWTIQDNIIRYGAHSAIELKNYGQGVPSFNKIINNTIDQYDYGIGWGLGIAIQSVGEDTNAYNLVEGNWIRSGGDSDVKQGIQINANGNTMRKNIIDSPIYKGIVYHTQGSDVAKRNMFYNNVIYNSPATGLQMSVFYKDPDDAMTDNLFANNILFMNGMGTGQYDYDLIWEFKTSLWWDVEWGGNIFKNNIIRHVNDGDILMRFMRQGLPLEYYTLADLQLNWPNVWFNNLEDDPLFVDAANSNFELQADSPAIDAGVPVRDTLGDVGGWSDLDYNGVDPDIGAFEYESSEPVCEATPPGECYYMSPSGTGDCLSYDTACTFSTAMSMLYTPGDVLYLKEGTYVGGEIPTTIQNRHGADGAPITIKNYPGEVPVIQRINCPAGGALIIFNGNSYITFEGIIFRPSCGSLGVESIITFLYGSSNHITFRGCEFDGSLSENLGNGILIYTPSDHITVEDCYIHDIHLPTGDAQGSGDGIGAQNCDFLYIINNVFERCNHMAMQFGGASVGSDYGKIINNTINVSYGGGISLVENSDFNLIEGNIVTHAGETTTYPKPSLGISGSNNTVRNNVIFSPLNEGLIIEGYAFGGTAMKADGNLVYNNVVFGTGYGYGFGILVFNDAGNGLPSCSAENNLFANNIVYKSIGQYYGYEPEVMIDTYQSNEEHNWLEPEESWVRPGSTNWGGNRFYNNLIRRASDGMSDTDLLIWGRDAALGGGWFTYSLNELENDGSTSWRNNIGSDPLLVSEYPDTYGLYDDWWHIQNSSLAIDAGFEVHDTIGAYMETVCGGCGWGDLTHQGNAPDIGAWESPYSAETGICGDDNCNPGETCNACPQDCIIGDVNGNCNVDLSDLITVAGNFGCSSNCGDSDIDDNNVVNILDLILVGKNFT